LLLGFAAPQAYDSPLGSRREPSFEEQGGTMRKLLIAVGLFVAGFVGSAQAQFCPGVSPWVFDDVQASDPVCPSITWMALNNITLGCKILGPLDRNYCPNDSVTRKQMAAFMNRLGNVRMQEVDTGPGLTGGPITLTGTIGLTAAQLLPTTACASGQVPQWNGTKWACAAAGGTGTVTSVAAGTGLVAVPSPITGSGTLNVALSYQLPQGCSNSQVAKSNGAGGWICAADSNSGGTVTSVATGAGLTGGPITTSGTISVDPNSVTLSGNFFKKGGNAFGATAVLGTTDNQPLELYVNNSRVMRYEPNAIGPNVIGGSGANSVTSGAMGAAIGGGGANGTQITLPLSTFDCTQPPGGPCANRVTDAGGTIGGGVANVAGNGSGTIDDAAWATVGGGASNTASGIGSTVAGGYDNTAGAGGSTVAGGQINTASGSYSTVAGGAGNLASGWYSTVAGGALNTASGIASFAAGYGARTQTGGGSPIIHDGAFVWADYNYGGFTFNSAAANEFAARATGGVRFVTAIDGAGTPTRTVAINTNGELGFGSVTRQMLNLWAAAYAIGVQTHTQYFRSDFNFAWYQQGVHSDAELDPGTSGKLLMSLTPSSSTVTPTGFARAQLFTSVSDRNAKTAFAPIEAKRVLASVAQLPITTWSFRNETDARHIGPVAQDFHAAFGVGSDDKTISTVDEGGVALAAIQGLYAELQDRDETIAGQQRQIADEQHEIAELRERMAQVESLRGELAALRNAIVATARGETIAARLNATAP
jgi:hypothetical protein